MTVGARSQGRPVWCSRFAVVVVVVDFVVVVVAFASADAAWVIGAGDVGVAHHLMAESVVVGGGGVGGGLVGVGHRPSLLPCPRAR